MAVCSAALLWLVASPVSGQFVQYTPPGSLGRPQVLEKERLEYAIQQTRWRMGALRLDPWYSIEDVSYNSNVFGTAYNQKGDWMTTVGAGIRGYVPTGPNLSLAIHALPEYVWWRDLSERRNLNGRYGAGLFGYFDRLTLEVKATSSEQQRYVSSEFEQPVNILRRRGSGTFEVEALGHFSVFGSGSADWWQYDDTGFLGPVGRRLLLMERQELVTRAGLRYSFREGLSLGLGVEHSDVEFLQSEGDRSNVGYAPLVELKFHHPRAQTDVSAAFRSLVPKDGSLFREFDGVTGRFLFNWKPGSRLEYQVYGTRNLAYTIYTESIYFLDQRSGVGISAPIGWRIRTKAFFEKGYNDYMMLDSSADPRSDDVTAYGGSARIHLIKGLEFLVEISRMSYDSNVPGGSRSIFRLRTAITMGDGDSEWF